MKERKIKCLVWDLDNTLWDGTLIAGDALVLRPGVREILDELDKRGILLSISSKNNLADGLEAIERFGFEDYFLYPQISWNPKSDAVKAIAKSLNIGLDAIAFIDDRPEERAEVAFSCPEVMTLDAQEYASLLSRPEFVPNFITSDSRNRRKLYQADQHRKREEENFKGTGEEFLKTLNMKLTLSPLATEDLERVEELTLRTNQLNSTGLTFDFDELKGFIGSENYIFLVAGLHDTFGDYGKIGLVLAEEGPENINIKLLIMSCRVMTRGIGSAILVYLVRLANERSKTLTADFIDTGKNRAMYVTYKLMGFEDETDEKLVYTGGEKQFPEYIQVTVN